MCFLLLKYYNMGWKNGYVRSEREIILLINLYIVYSKVYVYNKEKFVF